ncbi:hypothetical protein [Paludisphaera mucosa]|uniref:Uncharacterized protein n=1 Tax=Paludisphaera mucosa TaxID=3030827 RepID=A0ABT6FM76_9BACT|nr:hypothetical protein [Paludisphaera mucosa]MDG3008485.1 hypothetical protein [Paludisphaera mucosa]
MTTFMRRFYAQDDVRHEGPVNWIDLQTMDGRRLGACLSFATAELCVERRPGRTYRAVCWEEGRVERRYLVRATRETRSWRVRWVEEGSA